MTASSSNVPGAASERSSEAGFTLVEALIAIVILMVGLAAVSNLMIVSASSNTGANLSTAATASATEQIETLKSQPFGLLVPGSGFATTVGVPAPPTNTAYRTTALPAPPSGVKFPGVPDTRWEITTPTNLNPVRFIQVQSRMQGRLGAGWSFTQFSTIRACTEAAGCPF